MRVLYVTPFSQEISGADESLLDLLRELVPLGVEAHVALVERGPQASRYEAVGATVHVLPLSVLSRGLGALRLPSYLLRLARGTLAVRRLARSLGPDIIHTNMEVVLDGGLAARALGIPHVLHYRGNTIDEPRLVFDVLTRIWTRLADRVMCVSRATAQIFLKRGLGRNVEVVHDPVPVQRIAAEERSERVRSELGAAPGDILVGTVGRIHPRKGLATFIRACALVRDRVPQARFVIVGAAHGPMEEHHERELHGLASELGLDTCLRFAGMRRDVGAVMKALDLFVLSSRHEGFGRVAAEAMSAGTPVVLAREGALPEFIAEGDEGFLAAPGDASEFASFLVRLCLDDRLRKETGERAARSASRFAADHSASVVWERYLELLPPGGLGGGRSIRFRGG